MQRNAAEKHWEPLTCPLNNGEGFIRVLPDELASAAFDLVTSALIGEVPPLQVWHSFAAAFRRCGRAQECGDIFKLVIDNAQDMKEHMRDSSSVTYLQGKLLIENAFATYLMELARRKARADGGVKVEALPEFLQAVGKLTDIGKIDESFPMTELNVALVLLARARNAEDKNTKGDMYHLANAKLSAVHAKNGLGVVAALLGKAEVLANRGSYPAARDVLIRILDMHPHCGPDVRVAIGYCCFKLGEFERARLAFRRALQLTDFTNVEALIGEALVTSRLDDVGLERPEGRRNRQRAAHLITLADHFAEHKDSMALNHLSNILFFRWNLLPYKAVVVDPQTLEIIASPATVSEQLHHGDPLLINGTVRNSLMKPADGADHRSQTGTTVVKLRDPLPASLLGEGRLKVRLQSRDFDRALSCCNQAFQLTTDASIRSESRFLAARIHHARGNLSEARRDYKSSLAFSSDLPLSYLGYAQVMLDLYLDDPEANAKHLNDAYQTLCALEAKHQNFPEALSMQAAILAKMPKEMKADLRLTDEQVVEKRVKLLEEVTKISPQNAQAHLQLANALAHFPGKSAEALRSLEKVEELGFELTPSMHNNMAIFSMRAGKYEKAHRHMVACFGFFSKGDAKDAGYRIRQGENDLLGAWVKVGEVQSIEDACVLSLGQEGAGVEEGNLLLVGDARSQVLRVTASPWTIETKKRLPHAAVGTDVLCLRPAIPLDEVTRNYFYTLAQLHEARGFRQAATEVYLLLKERFEDMHECYCRLALIGFESGRVEEADQILSEGIERFGDKQNDLQLMRGYMHLSHESYRVAQASFSKVEENTQRTHPYALVGLANLYCNNLEDKKRYSKNLDHAASGFKRALKFQKSNAYAANGSAMTLVEKGNLPGAAEVFHRIRMVTVDPVGDASINLAHLKMKSNEQSEARSLYKTANQRLYHNCSAQVHSYIGLSHLLAKDRLGAMRRLQKAVHLAPFNLNAWYNCADVHEQHAEKVLLVEEAYTVERVRTSILYLEFGIRVSSWLIDAVPRFQSLDKQVLRSVHAYVTQLRSLRVDFQVQLLLKRRDFRVGQAKEARAILGNEIEKDRKRLVDLEERRRMEQEEEERLRQEQLAKEEEDRRREAEARKRIQEQNREKNKLLQQKQKEWQAQELQRQEAKKRQKNAKNAKMLSDDMLQASSGKRPEDINAAPQEVDKLDWGSDSDDDAKPAEDDVQGPEISDGEDDDDLFAESAADAAPAAAAGEGNAAGAAGDDEDDDDDFLGSDDDEEEKEGGGAQAEKGRTPDNPKGEEGGRQATAEKSDGEGMEIAADGTASGATLKRKAAEMEGAPTRDTGSGDKGGGDDREDDHENEDDDDDDGLFSDEAPAEETDDQPDVGGDTPAKKRRLVIDDEDD